MSKSKLCFQVSGEGPKNAKLMIIGEAPGRTEVELSRPFVGRAGRFLDKVLKEIGIERKKCYVTNIVKFRPTRVVHGKTKDRPPTDDEITLCMPLLRKELAEIRPRSIILLGGTAAKALTGRKISQIRGKAFRMLATVSPSTQSAVIATYHPAAAMRNRKFRKTFVADMRLAAVLQRTKTETLEFLQPLHTDWHVHTNCSDGRSAPRKVVEHARNLGLAGIAICDHDGVDGIREAKLAGERYGVVVVPSVEITANDTIDGKLGIVHILGIGIDYNDANLKRICGRLRGYRTEYIRKCIKRFGDIGIDVEFKDVVAHARGSLGFGNIMSVIRADRKKTEKLKAVLGIDEVPAFFKDTPLVIKDIAIKGLSVREASRVITAAGGIPVLAHPGNPNRYGILQVPDQKIREYARFGLQGIELSQHHHTHMQNKHYAKLAKKLGLMATTGSDSHKL